jgi:hypothetical protein
MVIVANPAAPNKQKSTMAQTTPDDILPDEGTEVEVATTGWSTTVLAAATHDVG